MADLPLCAQCQRRRVATRHNRYCSLVCSHAARKVLRPFCRRAGCEHRIGAKSQTYCSKQCAWQARGGIQIAAQGREKARAVLRQRYAARLREKLIGLDTKSAIWREAYKRGWQTCYASFLRQIRRGDILVVKERKVSKREAA